MELSAIEKQDGGSSTDELGRTAHCAKCTTLQGGSLFATPQTPSTRKEESSIDLSPGDMFRLDRIPLWLRPFEVTKIAGLAEKEESDDEEAQPSVSRTLNIDNIILIERSAQ